MEDQLQWRVATALRAREPMPLFCATGGGIFCPVSSRIKMVAMGYQKGIPDFILYEPRGGFHGMAIEFKSPKGRVRPEQSEWMEQLAVRGWYVVVHRNSDEALADIEKFLTLEE